MFWEKHMKSNVVVNHGDCKDQWNQIELGLLVMALLVVILTTMCLANEIHWAHSDSWSSLATFKCASCNVAKHFSNLKKSHCYQCAGNLHWFHLVSKIAPQHHTPRGHPAKDEVQVTLIVVITVIVAIAGQTTYDDIHPVQSGSVVSAWNSS